MADPLPSWRDGALKTRIQTWIAEVTTPGGPNYVTPTERVATFDDDGTLWPEKPRVQGMFALERLRERANDHPEWRTLLPFRAALELGSRYLTEASDDALMQILAAAHAGRTQDEFREDVRNFFNASRHPKFGQPYPRLAYQPMKELVSHLRANGFRIFIVTGGNVDVVRILAEQAYGIPSDDVVGSSVFTTFREEDGRYLIRRLERPHALNEGPMKPVSIDLHIGQRPILAVGNIGSGGDIDMLRYSQDQRRPTLQLLISHDDFEREFAYDEATRDSLDAAERRGWAIASMRFDWKQIFGFQAPVTPPPPVPVAAGDPTAP